MNRKERINALNKIIAEANNNSALIKNAQIMDSLIGFLKGVFSDFYNSIQSMWNPNSPALSILEFFAVGAITARSKLLGILISAIGLFLGVNVESIFNSIKGFLKPYLSSDEGLKELNTNSDQIIHNAVSNAVNPAITDTDEEIENKIQNGSQKSASNNIYSQNINKFGIKSKDIEKIAKFKLNSILPSLFGIFGRGKGGIVGLFFWVVKTLLLGAGIIGATGAVASIVGVKPQNQQNQQSTQEQSATYQASVPKQNNILNELKLSNYPSITSKRTNNAPDSLYDKNREGLSEWVVDNPTNNFADVLYDWTLSSYVNLGDVFKKYNLSSAELKSACSTVANSFKHANKSMSDFTIRIPQNFKTVKDVVEQVIRSL